MKKKKNHLVLDVYFACDFEKLKCDKYWVYCGNYNDFTSAEQFINNGLVDNGGSYIICVRTLEYELFITYKLENDVLFINYLQ